MSFLKKLLFRILRLNDDTEEPNLERESRKRPNSFEIENDSGLLEPENKRKKIDSNRSLQNISNFNMSNEADITPRLTGAVRKTIPSRQTPQSSRIWTNARQIEQRRSIGLVEKRRSVVPDSKVSNQQNKFCQTSNENHISFKDKNFYDHKGLYSNMLRPSRFSNRNATLNESVKQDHSLYKQLIKEFSPSSNKLSSGTAYYSLANASHKIPSAKIDLTKGNKVRYSFDKLTAAVNNKPIVLTDSDEEVVEVVQPKVNSLRKSLELQPLWNANWIDDITKQFSQTELEKRQVIHDVDIRSKLLNENNQQYEKLSDERFKKHLKLRETIIVDEESDEEVEEILPRLLPQKLENVAKALMTKSQEPLIQKFGLAIGRNDLRTLAGLNWLNDEVINFYMNLLNERSSQKSNLPKVYTQNTFFYPRLLQSGYAGVKRWTRKVDIFSYDLIPVPIHLKVHWCMAIIDLKHKAIRYYDSMGSPNNTCLNALEKYLQEESLSRKNTVLDTTKWIKENVQNIPQQMNGSDCGVFSCIFAEYLCRNAKLSFSQNEMPYFRKKMSVEILDGQLIT